MGKLVQFEMSAANLALSMREQIRRQRLCVTDEFPTPAGRAVVSRIEWPLGWVRAEVSENRTIYTREPFNSDPIVTYLPAKRVQLVQPATVSLSTIAQLATAGPSAPMTIETLNVALVFTLRVFANGNDVFLSIGFQGIEGLPEGVTALDNLKQTIAQGFPTQSLPLDVGELSGLGGKPTVANADITAHVVTAPPGASPPFLVEESVLAIRIELGNYPVQSDLWETFFATPANALFRATGRRGFAFGARSWAVFTDALFVTERARDQVEDGFKSGGFRLQGGVAADWSAPDGRALVQLDFYGEAIDACDLGIFGRSDIGLHAVVPIEISAVPPSVPFVFEPGALQQNIKINSWKDDWDTAACMAGVALVWPYLGPKLMDDNALTFWQMLGGFVVPPLIVIGGLKEALKGGKIPAPKPTKGHCVRPDEEKDEFVCVQPFETDGVPIGGAAPRLHDHFGRPDGLVLLGDMFWTQKLARDYRLTEIDTNAFRLATPQLSCGQVGPLGLAWIVAHPDWFVTYDATISLTFEREALPADNAQKPVSPNPNDVLFPYVCLARVRPEDDPLGVFAPYVTVDDTPDVARVTVRIPASSVPAAYFTPAHNYPCKILIHTSDGARLITLPPIVKASAEEIDRATKGAWAHKVSDCYAKSKSFDPRWIIDPAPGLRERHHWDVMISGLRPDERISLRDTRGRTVVAMRADQRGGAWLKALLAPEEYDGQLALERSGLRTAMQRSVNRHAGAEDYEEHSGAQHPQDYIAIDAKQTQLVELAEMEFAEAVVGLAPLMLGRAPAVALATASEIIVHDLSRPSRPRPVLRSQIPGVRGVAGFGPELFAWGEKGVFEIDLEGGGATRLSRATVAALEVAGATALVLRRGQLEIWSRSRKRMAVYDAAEARHLAAAGRHVLVGSHDGVALYQRLDDGTLRQVGEHAVAGLTRLAVAGLAGGTDQFLIVAAAGAQIVALADDGTPILVSEAPEPPALARFRRWRDLVFEAEAGEAIVRIHKAAATARL